MIEFIEYFRETPSAFLVLLGFVFILFLTMAIFNTAVESFFENWRKK